MSRMSNVKNVKCQECQMSRMSKMSNDKISLPEFSTSNKPQAILVVCTMSFSTCLPIIPYYNRNSLCQTEKESFNLEQ